MLKYLQAWFAANPTLYGSPLHYRKYALAALILLTIVLLLGLTQTLAYFTPFSPTVLGVFWVALGLSLLASFTTLTVLWFLDRREREARLVYVLAFLWGGAIATGLAMPLNQQIITAVTALVKGDPALSQFVNDQPMLLAAPIAGPLVEEFTKGLGVLVFFMLLRGEFDNMRDGFIYGALIGAGFNCLEVALYIAGGFAWTGVAPWGAQIGGRYALFGFAGHALYTGLFGAGLGWARQSRRRNLRWLASMLGLLLALAAHAWNNALPLIHRYIQLTPQIDVDVLILFNQPVVTSWLTRSYTVLVFFWPFYLLLLAGLWRSGVWERGVICTELSSEYHPIVTAAERLGLQHDRMWRTRRVPQLSRQYSRAVVNAQNELAFRKCRVRGRGQNPEFDPLVQHWRRRIIQLRTAAALHQPDEA
ncbi:hypothetical protein TFLX_06238 [Thermoflexales bacterium]|nr:hypothetical protein TFLX_06238 [Thermoflexales bacterium]